jgi:hypothetical protein
VVQHEKDGGEQRPRFSSLGVFGQKMRKCQNVIFLSE